MNSVSKQETPTILNQWNWGAFIFSLPWAIKFRLWGVLAFFLLIIILTPVAMLLSAIFGGPLWAIGIPVAYMLALGFRGNRWAWKKSKGATLEDFMKSQTRWSKIGKYFLLSVFFFWTLILSSAFISGNFGDNRQIALEIITTNPEIADRLGTPLEKQGLTFRHSVSYIKISDGWAKKVKMGLKTAGAKDQADIVLSWLEADNQRYVTRFEIQNKDSSYAALAKINSSQIDNQKIEELAIRLDAHRIVNDTFDLGYEILWNKEQAVTEELLQLAAEKGNLLAEFEFGSFYYIQKKYEEAFKWFSKAANQGHSRAQHNIGVMYIHGEHVQKDFKQGFEWVQKAAQGDFVDAQFMIADMYVDGAGTPKNLEKAFEWYMKAAQQGHLEAQTNIGLMYYNGEFVQKDLKQAFEWSMKAAQQGHHEAQYNIGFMYLYDHHVQKDVKQAFEWVQKAAQGGFADAQLLIADMYAEGLGTHKDLDKAYEWYMKASENGHKDAYSYAQNIKTRGKG